MGGFPAVEVSVEGGYAVFVAVEGDFCFCNPFGQCSQDCGQPRTNPLTGLRSSVHGRKGIAPHRLSREIQIQQS